MGVCAEVKKANKIESSTERNRHQGRGENCSGLWYMKIGSYIYTVNRVIYNLVYEYDNWDEWLNKWAQTGGIFGFFAGITFWMVERVRGLLKVAYNLMNINYMKLSREMEYHADLVAVSVSGVEPFKRALRKIEFSSFAYDYTTGNLQSLSTKKKASSNIYANHRFMISLLAKHNMIQNNNGDLIITDQDLNNSVVKSRVNIKDQWASHPTLVEREANISRVEVNCNENKGSAWLLFEDAEYLQERVTRNVYRTVFPEVNLEKLSVSDFEEFTKNEHNKYKISDVYNGFYEDRYLYEFDPKALINSTPIGSFEEIYSKKNVEIIKKQSSNEMDLQLLGQIALNQIPTKYFEFDGKKYKIKQAHKLVASLKEEVNQEKYRIEQLDKESFIFNCQTAKSNGREKELLQMYLEYFEQLTRVKAMQEINQKLQNFTNRLYSQPRWTENGIRQLAGELFNIEKEFKDFVKIQAFDPLINAVDVEAQKEALREYLNRSNYYSKAYEFDEEAFINLSNLVNDVHLALGILYGRKLKNLTDFQLELNGARLEVK